VRRRPTLGGQANASPPAHCSPRRSSASLASPSAAADQPLRRPLDRPHVVGTPVTVGSNKLRYVAQPGSSHDGLLHGATGQQVAINTVDRLTFQDQIENYRPDAQRSFTWFSGFRIKSFATVACTRSPISGRNFASNYATGISRVDRRRRPSSTMFRSTRTHGRHVSQESLAAKATTVPTTNQPVRDPCEQDEDRRPGSAALHKDGWPAMACSTF